MTLRKLAGFVLLVFGGWLLWGAVHWLILYTSRGAPLGDALADPAFLLPAVRSLAAVIAGLLAMFALRGALVLVLIAMAIDVFFIGAIIAQGGDSSLWMGKALVLAVFFPIALILALRPRTV